MKLKTIPSENHSEQLKWVSKNIKLISIFTFLALFGCMVLFFFLTRWQMMIVLGAGIIGLGYNIVITKNGMSLRKIPFMKAIWISLVWTFLTLVLPISENGIYLGDEVFILRFLFIFILTIPFDIRDLKYDDDKMKTLPQVLGVKGSILFGWILLATCMCLAFSIFTSEIAIILSVSYLLTGITLLFSLKERKEIFYPMVVDGMIVLQGMMVVGWVLFKV
jgi:hypothetical protein